MYFLLVGVVKSYWRPYVELTYETAIKLLNLLVRNLFWRRKLGTFKTCFRKIIVFSINGVRRG